MRSVRKRHATLVASALILTVAAAACVTEPVAPASTAPTASSAPSSDVTPSPPEATVGPPESIPAPTPVVTLPRPGRPFDATAVLDAMAGSRRPGGVPDQMETQRIAARVAEELWTFDGSPWQSIVAGGSCGPTSCMLEVSGRPAGAAGEDVYVFDVDPASGSVALLDATLQGLPPTTVDQLDALAHAAWDGDLDGMALASVSWRAPPDDGRFLLAYRSGGEEGSPGVDLVLDAIRGTVEPA